jgi:hypothetical protein
VAGVAVELALRRYLSEKEIPFDVRGATPFTDPDRYDVALGGHRCDLKSFLITHREQIMDMRRNPGIILKAPALVPLDQHAADGHTDRDLYLFAFLSGLIAASQDDLKKVIASCQPYYLMHPMPDAWCKPLTWSPLGPLSLKSESDAALTVEIGGQDEGREFRTRVIELPPRRCVVVDDPFFARACLHVKSLPSARIGVHSPVRDETYLISPLDWGNIWVYGMDILLAGYISREEFGRRAQLIQPGSRVFQYNQTRAKNLAIPFADLKPLTGLFEQVRVWETKRNR